MNPNENYQIVNGKVLTKSLEIHIVDHCNLRCWGCCSLSPVSAKHLARPDDISRDLTLAKSVLSPTRLKLVGGEPLLHPQILDCITAARESNIAKSLSITTNGFMLLKMETQFWEIVDHMTISLYPSPELPKKSIAKIKELAEKNDVELNWKTQETFVGMDRNKLDHTALETSKVYSECWLRRRCHLIANGRFYTCTRPSHMHSVSGLDDSPYLHDGVLLESGKSIYDYLLNKTPLSSCALCLGGSSKSEPHRQLSLPEIKSERILRKKIYQEYAQTVSK